MKKDKMWVWYFAVMRENMCILFFVGKPERRKPFGRTRHRWNDNVETDI